MSVPVPIQGIIRIVVANKEINKIRRLEIDRGFYGRPELNYSELRIFIGLTFKLKYFKVVNKRLFNKIKLQLIW